MQELRTRLAVLLITFLLALSSSASGQTPLAPLDKIANGVPSQDFPSVGMLQTASTTCSGTLVGCQTFLTAAHCLCEDPFTSAILNGKQCNARPDLLDPAGLRVYFQHAGFFAVESVAVHPGFQFQLGSDLAILKLAQPVTGIGTSRINRVAKPSLGTTGTIAGFGVETGGTRVGIKRSGAVTTANCIGVNNATHVCFTYDNPLGPPGGNSDTCQGDSGGPLFVNFGDGDVVAGVTSGGDSLGCHPVDHSFDADVFRDRAWLSDKGGVDLDRGFCGAVPPVGSLGAAAVGAFGSAPPADGSDGSAGSDTVDGTPAPPQIFNFTVPAGTERLRLALNTDSGADFTFAAKATGPANGPPAAGPGSAGCQAETLRRPAYCEILAPVPGSWSLALQRKDQRAGNANFQLTTTVLAHRVPPGPCFPSATALCLLGGRFRLEAAWQTVDGSVGEAQLVPLSDLSGFLWYFTPGNPEALVKMIDACSATGRYWFFAAGLTDVKTLVTVTDTQTGSVRTYLNPQSNPFEAIIDAGAFPCP